MYKASDVATACKLYLPTPSLYDHCVAMKKPNDKNSAIVITLRPSIPGIDKTRLVLFQDGKGDIFMTDLGMLPEKVYQSMLNKYQTFNRNNKLPELPSLHFIRNKSDFLEIKVKSLLDVVGALVYFDQLFCAALGK